MISLRHERNSECVHFLNLAKILVFQKKGFFRQDLAIGNIHIWSGTIEFLVGLFCNFLAINTHTFAKNHPKFENKSLFFAKFYAS